MNKILFALTLALFLLTSCGNTKIAENNNRQIKKYDSESLVDQFSQEEQDSKQLERISKKDAKKSKEVRHFSDLNNNLNYLEQKGIRENKRPISEEIVDQPLITAPEEIIRITADQIQEPEQVILDDNSHEALSIENEQNKTSEEPAAEKTPVINEYKAVIYFKNGARMNGTITEHPSGNLTIKLPGGTIMESTMKDIDKIERK